MMNQEPRNSHTRFTPGVPILPPQTLYIFEEVRYCMQMSKNHGLFPLHVIIINLTLGVLIGNNTYILSVRKYVNVSRKYLYSGWHSLCKLPFSLHSIQKFPSSRDKVPFPRHKVPLICLSSSSSRVLFHRFTSINLLFRQSVNN